MFNSGHSLLNPNIFRGSERNFRLISKELWPVIVATALR
jgi:hypothetical protein